MSKVKSSAHEETVVAIILPSNFRSRIATGAYGSDQFHAAAELIREIAGMVTTEDQIEVTELNHRVVVVDGGLALEILCTLPSQGSLMLETFPTRRHLTFAQVFALEVASWQKVLARTFGKQEIAIIDLPAIATAATRTQDLPVGGRAPIASQQELDLTVPLTLFDDLSKGIQGGNEFNLDHSRSRGVPVWGSKITIRGMPQMIRDGFEISVLEPPNYARQKLIVKVVDLMKNEVISLVEAAYEQRAIDLDMQVDQRPSSNRRLAKVWRSH